LPIPPGGIVWLGDGTHAMFIKPSVRYRDGDEVPATLVFEKMEHQASIQLVDAQGQFFGTLVSEEGFDVRLAKVRRLIGS
jgi:copper(I)-binding protein